MSIELLESGSLSRSFRPNSIVSMSLPDLFSGVPESVKNHARKLIADDWRFYCVSQNHGRCYASFRVITIPAWAVKKDAGYKTWYISHEIAHALDHCLHNHGHEFMEWLRLKVVCPIESLHYELTYKPRNAAAAGIVDPAKPRKYTLADFLEI